MSQRASSRSGRAASIDSPDGKGGGNNDAAKIRASGRRWIWPRSFADSVALCWYLIDALTHLTMELSYVYFTLAAGGAKNSESVFAFVWKEYGKADKRWASYDSTVLSLELLTVFIMGPLALLAAYGVWKSKPWRHVAQIVLCACELYGGAMTFFPEWLSRPANPNLSSSLLHTTVYLGFMNLVWVFIPAILLVDSAIILTRAAAKLSAAQHAAPPPSGNCSYYLIAATLALYILLVPAVILFSSASPAP